MFCYICQTVKNRRLALVIGILPSMLTPSVFADKQGRVYVTSASGSSTVQASAPPLTLRAGDTGEILAVHPECYSALGFQIDDIVSLGVSGYPSGATATYDPNPVNTFNYSVLTIGTLDSTTPGSYPLTLTAFGPYCGFYSLNYVTLTITPRLTLLRLDLMDVKAGANGNGTFSYKSVSADGGKNIAKIDYSSGSTSTTNPNYSTLTNPKDPANPAPGALAIITATYALNGLSDNRDLSVPTFGVSCYKTTLESDWGSPSTHCKSVRFYGTTYSGTVTNPNNLQGTFCASFIQDIKVQGSGVLNDGTKLQYDVGGALFNEVSVFKGSDGTEVVAGHTVARDKAIIPGVGILVDVDRLGTGLLANDTGGAILGYRLDIYNGIGAAVCAKYNNIISVGACSPSSGQCPGSDIQ